PGRLNPAQSGPEPAGDPVARPALLTACPPETGLNLFLPGGAPIILGPGLVLAQIESTTSRLRPFDEAEARAAEDGEAPRWLTPKPLGPGREEIFRSENLTVTRIVASSLATMVSPDATTFLWPLSGQGRIRSQGPAPTTRLRPGRAVMLPARLGRYAVESAGAVEYLLIEAV
ncbi:MAG: hypothetical protein LBS31_01500, partial [Candidatus Adiutrix sp.]|nr:hypothetical protein [Candidatus Adiutrix sp.]